MSRRKPRTKFDLDDRVLITGPTAASFDTGRTHALPPGSVGTVADLWEAFSEYIVVLDSGGTWVFPESSLDTEGGVS